jgi:hypothetical protein
LGSPNGRPNGGDAAGAVIPIKELGITRQTLYRHVGPDGALREDGKRLLCKK